MKLWWKQKGGQGSSENKHLKLKKEFWNKTNVEEQKFWLPQGEQSLIVKSKLKKKQREKTLMYLKSKEHKKSYKKN